MEVWKFDGKIIKNVEVLVDYIDYILVIDYVEKILEIDVVLDDVFCINSFNFNNV